MRARIAVLACTTAVGSTLAGVGALPTAATAAPARVEPAVAPVTAYAYANKPSKHSYRPEANYAYNAAGSINVKRHGVGDYTVTFFGLGAVASQGTVDVTAEGFTPAVCNVVKWEPDATNANLLIDVACRTFAGVGVDTPYMVAFTSGGTTTGEIDYVLANKPSAASYTPRAANQFNASGKKNKITRTAVGQYDVSVPGSAGVGGSVKVTLYGSAPGDCQVFSWVAFHPGHHVYVDCYDTAGAPADRAFTMTFTASDDLLGDGGHGGYVWGNDPTSSAYTPNRTYEYDWTGSGATVNRLGTGQYEVAFPGSGVGNTGDEQATPYGPGDTHCIVDGPAGVAGGQQTGDVFCFDNNGNPVDAPYTMQWWNHP